MIGGPYHPPKCRIGSILRDKMLGPVRVVGRDENRWPGLYPDVAVATITDRAASMEELEA